MCSENRSLLGMLKPLMIVTGTWKLDKNNSRTYRFYWFYACIYQGIGLTFAFLVTIKFIQFVATGADITCMMFVALMLYSVRLLKIQHNKIRRCDWPAYNIEDSFNDIKNIIVSHRRVIGFIRDVNKSIRYVVLVDVLLNSINIASLATYLTTARSGESLFSVSYLLVQIMQVVVLGLLANEIKFQSQATANVLYNLNWHYLDTKNRKIFLMMLTQCQQIAVISIGPFGPMSINSVISVIKAAYSYMMVMQSYK
ncbi:hypothetical protein HUJ04_001429 [Dendroctonus ponderosae]|nr:hypothetical protein HUJ04_001429 [Dendroctonus ponderosae]